MMMSVVVKFWNWLLSFWVTPIKKEQRKYNKSNILKKYDPKDWKEDLYW